MEGAVAVACKPAELSCLQLVARHRLIFRRRGDDLHQTVEPQRFQQADNDPFGLLQRQALMMQGEDPVSAEVETKAAARREVDVVALIVARPRAREESRAV